MTEESESAFHTSWDAGSIPDNVLVFFSTGGETKSQPSILRGDPRVSCPYFSAINPLPLPFFPSPLKVAPSIFLYCISRFQLPTCNSSSEHHVLYEYCDCVSFSLPCENMVEIKQSSFRRYFANYVIQKMQCAWENIAIAYILLFLLLPRININTFRTSL